MKIFPAQLEIGMLTIRGPICPPSSNDATVRIVIPMLLILIPVVCVFLFVLFRLRKTAKEIISKWFYQGRTFFLCIEKQSDDEETIVSMSSPPHRFHPHLEVCIKYKSSGKNLQSFIRFKKMKKLKPIISWDQKISYGNKSKQTISDRNAPKSA